MSHGDPRGRTRHCAVRLPSRGVWQGGRGKTPTAFAPGDAWARGARGPCCLAGGPPRVREQSPCRGTAAACIVRLRPPCGALGRSEGAGPPRLLWGGDLWPWTSEVPRAAVASLGACVRLTVRPARWGRCRRRLTLRGNSLAGRTGQGAGWLRLSPAGHEQPDAPAEGHPGPRPGCPSGSTQPERLLSHRGGASLARTRAFLG